MTIKRSKSCQRPKRSLPACQARVRGFYGHSFRRAVAPRNLQLRAGSCSWPGRISAEAGDHRRRSGGRRRRREGGSSWAWPSATSPSCSSSVCRGRQLWVHLRALL